MKDHLGSTAVLVNETGVVAERLAYDAWGKRRHPNGADDLTHTLTSQTTRGFTGHEMIDEMDLVNMNGRVYDPVLGRFLSADPFIHDVTNSQDLNRYSYVHNNPLSFTDMNGYGFFKSIGKFFKKFWKVLLAIVISVVLPEILPAIIPGTAPAQVLLNAAITQGIASGVASVIVTGRPKAFLSGFGEGFLTAGLGARFSGSFGGRFVSHGVIGGAFTEIRGGKFSAGFLSAGFTAAVAPVFGPQGRWGGAAFRAAVGGTASVLGGGKFADGAVTGAFAYLATRALTPQQYSATVEGAMPVEVELEREIIFSATLGYLQTFGKVPYGANITFVNQYVVTDRRNGKIVGLACPRFRGRSVKLRPSFPRRQSG